jgi:predicted acyltransferase
MDVLGAVKSRPHTGCMDMGPRVLSIDILRGLTIILWLCSETLVPVLNGRVHNSFGDALAIQLSPSLWRGVTVFDLIVPTLVFVAGAAIAPAFAMRRAAGQTAKKMAWRIARRLILLSGIGLLLDWNLFETFPAIRYVGTLQRLAFCYTVAASLELMVHSRVQIALAMFMLIGYGVAAELSSPSGDSSHAFTFDENLAAITDGMLLPGRKYFGTWDPDGVVTSIPAIAVAIVGLLAGKMLMIGQRRSDDVSLRMCATGIVVVNAGCLCDFVIPCIPSLWTSSFCLVSIGTGLCLLGLFHAARHGRIWSSWSKPLAALGRNTLIVALSSVLTLRLLAQVSSLPWYGNFLCSPTSPRVALLALMAVTTLVFWFDRRKWYVTA